MTLEELYLENYAVVYGYLLSLCGSPAMAEDLTSEVFLRAMEKIHTFDGKCRPSTWLCAIGRNLYFNERKRLSRHTELEKVKEMTMQGSEEAVLDKAYAQQILRAAQKLGEPQKQVFFMRVSGLSFREIGEALGKTETWARVTFFRTKTKLLTETEG